MRMRIIFGKGVFAVQQKETIKQRFTNSLFEYFAWVPVGVSLFVCIALFFARSIVVSGHSMQPTLQNGDLMLTSGLFYEPSRGDVVVLNKETFFYGQPIVKRVIAVAGDNIDINFQTGEVWLNGTLLDEPYIAEPTYTNEGMPFPQTVPKGCVFVMGDNRNHSDDSRHPNLGMVDTRYIIGRVCVVLPFGKLFEELG